MEIRERCSWQHSSGKTEIEDLKYEAERAERDGDYGKVAEISYEIKKEKLESSQNNYKKINLEHPNKGRVTREDIAEVVAKWTGIPVMKMLQGERKNCLN
jgi:ATP-dependent Clp protease ATP-binding subunit ClpB